MERDGWPRCAATRDRDVQIALAYADLSRDWTAPALAEAYGITTQMVYRIVWEYAPRVAEARGRSAPRTTSRRPW
jgi:hypothetical protein